MKESKPRETFWQYITRPTGFGRTQWSFWICVVVVMGYGATLVVADWRPGVFIPVGLCFAITTTGIVLGTIKNWKTDRYGLPTNPNNHTSDVIGEGKPFPVMREPYGAPIMEFKKWFMARYACSEEQYLVRTLPLPNDKMFRDEHRAYLANKRFDKFLRK